MKLLILGIDPGTTAAFALTTLEGELVRIFSKKNISVDELINQIIEASSNDKIVFVGCDKGKPPKAVMRISSKLGVQVINPEHDLSINEKHKLINEYYGKVNLNAHELDALASSLFVIKRINSRLNKAIAKLKHDVDISKYLYELLTTSKSREQIIQEMQQVVVFQEKKPKRVLKEKNQIALLQYQIHELLEENKMLRKQLKQEKFTFKQQLNEKFLFLTSKIFTLNKDIDRLKNALISFFLCFEFLHKRYNIQIAVKENSEGIPFINIPYIFKGSSKIYDKKRGKELSDVNVLYESDDFVVFSEQNINALKKIESLIEQYKAERKSLLKK